MAKRTLNPRINAGDVAALAKVSRSAVSRTFTAGASVSPQTRSRVLAAASALGYSRIGKLRTPADAAGRLIGVIMADWRNPYFAELSDRLDREIVLGGAHMLFLLCADPTRIDAVVADALARQVQGIVISAALPSPEAMAAAQAARVPIVLMNRADEASPANLVWNDSARTGRAVARLLLDEGRRHPVALAGTPFRAPHLAAFAEAMEAGGSAPCRWSDSGWSYEDGAHAAMQVLGAGDRPDAVFAASDALAIGFLDAARTRFDVAVPEAMSIVGFGDTAPADWMSHRISSVRIPIDALIETTVGTLFARMDGASEPPPRIWLGCDIIERDSTRGAAALDDMLDAAA